MTRAATPVISVRFDERPREWRNFFQLRSVDELVDAIVSPPPEAAPAYVRGHREIHLGDRPYDPLHAELAPMMLVAVGPDGGAVYFREVNADGRSRGFIAQGDGRVDAPRLPFDSQGAIEFEPRDVMSRDQLRAIVRAYLLDGVRPETVRWRDSQWVQ
ncbi:Imm1 family immunity protein [Labedaea rhizosphaerae]|uniref:Immunity protein Imm1 of predicted polymorphic toxin system n=1 Tax=Labedaea rhizosphaerae TaxID=598644 RepID=A0A4R6SGE4_LABRH|nr:Imm1 family immunity protein [Labedaea rhizosphaerae]TDQ01092.1 immunity protein Imm1 of predicted polymorphic toxin system [Labedaea rhizosphaerae]